MLNRRYTIEHRGGYSALYDLNGSKIIEVPRADTVAVKRLYHAMYALNELLTYMQKEYDSSNRL